MPSGGEGLSIPTASPEDENRSIISETLCSLEYWTMDAVQKPSKPKFYALVFKFCVSEHGLNKNIVLKLLGC
jgi:hypothetical protein